MEPLILYSSKNIASKNIADHFNGKKIDNPKHILDVVNGINIKNRFIIVFSTHRSKSNFKCLTVHIPGNYSNNEMGGEKETLNIAYCSMMRNILGNIKELNKKYNLKYNVTYEVDHHGPTIDQPIMFVEIGSTEEEWKNPLAGKIIAEAVEKALDEREEYDCFFGVGGGHYASRLTRFSLKENFALGHILPNYQIPNIKEDVFKQAIFKNVEILDGILIDKKKIIEKDKILKMANKFGIEVREV